VSKEKFSEILKGNAPDQSMGAIEAVKEGIQAIAPGLTLSNILHDVGAEMKRLGVQGQMEMASAIFGNGAFVPYGPGQYTPHEATHGQSIEATKQPEVQQEQSRAGREM
jgi:hypothetical protein